jgi:hypothetical protein
VPPEEASRLLRAQPDALLQPAAALAARLEALRAGLGGGGATGAGGGAAGGVAWTAQRAAQCAPLLAAPAGEVQRRLAALRALLGVPERLAAELALKAPELLLLGSEELAARFDLLAASFGAFREDAVGIVLADPDSLLRVSARNSGPAPGGADGSGGSGGSGGAAAAGADGGPERPRRGRPPKAKKT